MKFITFSLLFLAMAGAEWIPTEKTDIACYLFGSSTIIGNYAIAEIVCPVDGSDDFGTFVSKEFVKTWLCIFAASVETWLMRNHFTDDQLQWVAIGKGHSFTIGFGVNVLRWARLRARDRARVPTLECLQDEADFWKETLNYKPAWLIENERRKNRR